MAEALILLSKPKLKDVNKYCELDDRWYSLGIELEIDNEELDELREKYSYDPHIRMIKMFSVWLKKGENPLTGSYSRHWRILAKEMWQNY